MDTILKIINVGLNHFKGFSIMFDIVLSQCGPLYILRGHMLKFPAKMYVSFSEDLFCHSKQCRQ